MAAKEIAIAVPLVALVVGGFYLWDKKVQPKLDKFQSDTQSGRAAGAVVTGDVLVLFDAITVTRRDRPAGVNDDNDTYRTKEEARTRVTVVDLATGASLRSLVLPAGGAGQAAGPGTLWCDFDGLALHDAKTLQKIVKVDDAIAKAGAKPVPTLWRIGDGGALAHLVGDGRVAMLDGATGRVTMSDTVPPSLRRNPIGQSPLPGRLDTTGAQSCAEGLLGAHARSTPVSAADFAPGASKKKSPPAPIFWRVDATANERAHLVAGSKRSTDSYLRPTILGAADPPIVLHHSSIDPKDDGARLSRLSPTGATAWTVELGAPRCETLTTSAERYLVTTENAKQRALAIDPQSGTVRWRVAF